MTVRLAIFDLDNTLLDRAGAVRRWADAFVARHRLDPAETEWIIGTDGDGFSPRPAFALALRERYGLPGTPDEMLRNWRTEIVELIEAYPGTVEGLTRLREAGWRLAIATNGNDAQQRAKISRNGLHGHVDAIVTSEEAGAGKPDARVFQLVAARLRTPLTGTDWMVGDCAIRDVGGARALGLRTVWLRRDREWDATAPAPDAIVDTVPEAVVALLSP